MRAEQLERKQKPRYTGRCRGYQGPPPVGVDPVVRFKNPLLGRTVVDDQVRGQIVFQNSELDDLVIARADGSPTYNLTVVVDDLDMGITHVIRGDDHLNNTPRQINILRALGIEPPRYAHVPMILGSDGKRLSKRHGAVSVLQYRDQGFLPQALLNYLVRLGWSHGDQEIFTREEMVQLFNIKDINHSAAIFNPGKLVWLNQYYIKESTPEHVIPHLTWQMQRLGIPLHQGPKLERLLDAQKERAKTLAELASNSRFLYVDLQDYDAKAAAKHLTAEAAGVLQSLADALVDVDEWHAPAIHRAVTRVSEETGLSLGRIAQPLRVAVSGGAVSPPIDITLSLMGRTRTLARVEHALDYIRAKKHQ
jgi:glutamyl-tRNA synthetase